MELGEKKINSYENPYWKWFIKFKSTQECAIPEINFVSEIINQ